MYLSDKNNFRTTLFQLYHFTYEKSVAIKWFVPNTTFLTFFQLLLYHFLRSIERKKIEQKSFVTSSSSHGSKGLNLRKWSRYNSIRSPTKNGLQSFPRRLCSRVLPREKEIFCLRAERAVSDLQGETGSKNFNRVAPMQIAGDLLRGIILRPKAGRTNFVQMTGSGPAGGGGGFSWGCLAPSVIIFTGDERSTDRWTRSR